MPPRRRAAAAAAKTPPLEGCAVAFSGRFNKYGHSHGSLEQLVRELGGKTMKSVGQGLTHLVCTEQDYNDGASKVGTAQAQGTPLVKPEWLLECEKQQTAVGADEFLWTAGGAATDGPTDGDKKRPIAVTDANGDGDDEDKPRAKKPKANGKAATKANGKADAKNDGDGDDEDKPSAKQPKAKGKADATKDDDSVAKGTEKVVAEGQFIRNKSVAIPLDDHCPLVTSQVHVDPSTGMIYDASLNQSSTSNNHNKFYRLQILRAGHLYKTWTRWGRVGEAGQNAILGDGSLASAVKFFEKKFRDKSGLHWDDRGADPKPGKYAFVERSYNPDSDDEDDGNDEDDSNDGAVKKEGESKVPESTLERPVQELMRLIFNQEYFKATMSSLNYDANKLPLGKLSKATITRGFQQLKDLAALMGDPSLAASRWSMALGAATEHLSNTYYSLIPHAFGRHRPPVISSDEQLKREIELLESLSDMKDAADIMKIDRKTAHTMHPQDRQFQSLGMEEMTPLDPAGGEFALLAKYLTGSRGSTHSVDYKLQHIFRIERQGETSRFSASKFASIPSDRRLLWHGSRCTNFGGILSQGLRIAPPEAPVSGYMFGKGIYLADLSSKSAGYCAPYDSGGHALLLLCEAELGNPMQRLKYANYDAGEEAAKQGMVSTWGLGDMGPSQWMDAGAVHESLKGIRMATRHERPAREDRRARREPPLQRVHLLRRRAGQAAVPLPRPDVERA
ncbi:Poly [ADP-ribose] polymerase [Tolypocladium paradoxum]|uniref:Poly [ADP-ribose] polymerase n=1 Tax=Tolypocladium paradoxum TaxID=94208 RepID=A0A2S4KLF9_9HYPO|nr:Poly [ADP-ribose] polymerase [Tolypocladium paradoxum]